MISLWVQVAILCLCPARKKKTTNILILTIYSSIFWNRRGVKVFGWTLDETPVYCIRRHTANPLCRMSLSLDCGRKSVWPWNRIELGRTFKLHSWRPPAHESNLWTTFSLKEFNIRYSCNTGHLFWNRVYMCCKVTAVQLKEVFLDTYNRCVL